MSVREISTAPSLATLYPKALLRRGGGSTLPDTELVRPSVEVSAAHVSAYAQVCGFRFSDELPATYPHLLVFGLQMTLMTEPGFPFPLLGLVHVANSITVRRPLLLSETFTARVRAENLRPHEKGRQFDMVSELWVGTELVWSEVSTYLRRGGSSASRPHTTLVPPTPTALWTLPADTGRRYAEVSGDRNPIHLHALTARLFGFPRAIAHGMWTKAHALASFEGRLPDAYTVAVRFKQPVLLPARAAFTAWPTDEEWAFELWHARQPKPHLDGVISAL
ncbi:MaoC/PaaZ C-terminal domain-containing protein [Amycolatopsis rhabdoformis]|uniref:MaoC/PaaZ C-terminal domain-containing protein n=1 Tax=Amycolatopsis rhabdoformis TaxID=1448059 RepID=A0ABZ1I391_9PSEU|nr:MaoC/PaaZ C-terminal domain-containing protein [Amycolatopsis rhabdoformis]WSE28262.1 MaoC/PaaZ C-terminal domain-containing protein [Amycolatopsis rhabdoformis]